MYLCMREMCKIKNQVKESIASHYQLLAVRHAIQKVGMQIYWSMAVMRLRIFTTFFKVLGLYQLAQECHSLQEPTRSLQEPALRTNQDFVQMSPPPDELLFVLMTRSILICQPEESPSTTILNPQKTPVPQQDRASTKSDSQQKNCETLAPQEITFLQLAEIFPSTQEHQEEPVPSESTTDHHPVNETPVH